MATRAASMSSSRLGRFKRKRLRRRRGMLVDHEKERSNFIVSRQSYALMIDCK